VTLALEQQNALRAFRSALFVFWDNRLGIMCFYLFAIRDAAWRTAPLNPDQV
jgi:hypothetical protein